MNVELINFNTEEYFFLQIREFYLDFPGILNKFKYKTSIENYDNFYVNVLRQAFKISKKFKIVIYSIKTEFNNLYSLGITIEVNFILIGMEAINYTRDENRLEFYNVIKTYLRDKFNKQFNCQYIDIYLENLLFYFMDDYNYQKFLNESRHFGDSEDETFKRAIVKLKDSNISMDRMNIISNIISKRKIYLSTSYNSFNLHQTNEVQQKALSIKKTTSNGNKLKVDYVDYDYNKPNDEFDLINYLYIPIEKVEYLYFKKLSRVDLTTLIAKNFIYKYKMINDSSPSTINLLIQIKESQLKILNNFKIRGKPCQFIKLNNFINDTRKLIIDGVFNYKDEFSEFKDQEWIYGEEMLYDYNQFSFETLKGNSRRIEFYAIFHLNALKDLISKTGCTFIIKRRIGNFYYTSCFLYKNEAQYLFTIFIPKYINACETLLDSDDHLNHLWKMRKMLHVIYHTYFSIHQYIKNEENISILKESMIKNLTNFLYIKETGELYNYPTNDLLGIRYMGIFIKVQQAVFKDYNDVKFTPIQPKYDGPLVSAVSVRGCENVTNSKYHDKDYNVYASYLSIILNTPNYSGINNELNKIILN